MTSVGRHTYVKVEENRAKPYGLHVVGLRRHGFSPEILRELKETYRIVFAAGLNTSQALARFRAAGRARPRSSSSSISSDVPSAGSASRSR